MTRHDPAVAASEGSGGDRLSVGTFFTIAALSVSIVAFVLLRGQPLEALTLVALTLLGAGLTAAAVYRAVAPLGETFQAEPLVAGHTRAALERDKALALRSLKELEFDHAMGKVSENDFREQRERLRARAVRLMAELDGAAMYRSRIERDLAALAPAGDGSGGVTARPACGSCGTANDADARFCKQCGAGLAGGR